MPRPIPSNDGSEKDEPRQEDWLALRFAQREIRAGRVGSATTVLREVLRDTPDFRLARALLGHCLLAVDRERRALRHFDRVGDFSDVPSNVIADYATLLGKYGRADEQKRLIQGTNLRESWVVAGAQSRQSQLLEKFSSLARNSTDTGVYYHVPFCGGTSITAGIERLYGSSLTIISRTRGRREIPPLLARLASSEPPAMVRLHHPYPLSRHGDFRWFTVLRDPYNRFVSGYRKRLDPRILPTRDFSSRPSLEATIRNAEDNRLNDLMARELAVLSPEISNRFSDWASGSSSPDAVFEEDLHYVQATADLTAQQLYRLALHTIEERLEFVGITEDLETTYLVMFGLLGHRAVPGLVNRGRSLARDTPSDDQVARIRNLHEVDQAVYEYVRRSFEKKYVSTNQ